MLDLNMQLPVRKLFQVMIGTTLLGGGISLNFLGNLGLGPWGAFHDGLSKITGISYGTAIILTGVFVTFLWIPLKQKPGIGTILNAIIISIMIDVCIKFVPTPENYLYQIILAVLAVLTVGIGGGIYLVANLGPGPRDGLMVGLQKKTNLPIAVVRALLEISAVSIGWFLGGTVGIGTLLFAFGIGPAVALGLFLTGKIFK